jgi:hypothetical protein
MSEIFSNLYLDKKELLMVTSYQAYLDKIGVKSRPTPEKSVASLLEKHASASISADSSYVQVVLARKRLEARNNITDVGTKPSPRTIACSSTPPENKPPKGFKMQMTKHAWYAVLLIIASLASLGFNTWSRIKTEEFKNTPAGLAEIAFENERLHAPSTLERMFGFGLGSSQAPTRKSSSVQSTVPQVQSVAAPVGISQSVLLQMQDGGQYTIGPNTQARFTGPGHVDFSLTGEVVSAKGPFKVSLVEGGVGSARSPGWSLEEINESVPDFLNSARAINGKKVRLYLNSESVATLITK